jgi:myosin heavy subunit
MIGVLRTCFLFVRYTAIGDVLVAVNPYERLAKPPGISLYDSKVAWHYFSTVHLY